MEGPGDCASQGRSRPHLGPQPVYLYREDTEIRRAVNNKLFFRAVSSIYFSLNKGRSCFIYLIGRGSVKDFG